MEFAKNFFVPQFYVWILGRFFKVHYLRNKNFRKFQNHLDQPEITRRLQISCCLDRFRTLKAWKKAIPRFIKKW